MLGTAAGTTGLLLDGDALDNSGGVVKLFNASGDEAVSMIDNMEKAEMEKTLHRSLARLPEDQREILVLSRFQELKYEEIAKITETTVANVKVKVHRAIKKLRDTYFELERI